MDVLIIRLTALGDIIHCLPAVAYMRRQLPDSRITWLVEPAGLELLANNPAVDEVLVLPKKTWVQGLGNPARWPAITSNIATFRHQLAAKKYAAAVDFQGLLKSAVCASISGAPRRFGFQQSREGSRLFMTDTVDVGDYFGREHHVVDLNLRLAEFACARLKENGTTAAGTSPEGATTIEFPLPAVDSATSKAIAERAGLTGNKHPVIAVVPGTTWDTKIWPSEHWRDFVVLAGRRLGAKIIVAGGPGEKVGNANLAAQIRLVQPDADLTDLTGQTSLLELIALFGACDIVVGGDTGPVHLAAATGKPAVLGIHGSTPTGRNGPYGSHCRTIALNLSCQPCFAKVCPLGTLACLKDLGAEQVFNAAEELLKRA